MERDSGQVEELAKRLGISVQQLDYWMMMGVLSPSLYDGQKGARRGFSNQDMEALRILREFVPGVSATMDKSGQVYERPARR